MSEITLCASILSADFASLADQIHQLENSGVDWIHVDVMDGHFVPNLTMGPFIVKTVRRLTPLPIDVHLMVERPEVMIPWYVQAGANRISVQIETCPHILRTVEQIRAAGCHPGVVLNPGTPVETLSETLPFVDLVLVMTVNPGYSGQTFIPAMLPKIGRVQALIQQTHSSALIQVDGGIDTENLPACHQAGARVIVSATSIFSHPQGIAAGVAALRQVVA
jgi:ribulose-phosphate 3-epimerase